MALVLSDRVKETCISPGVGAVTLLGAVMGFQSFAAIGNGNTTYYAIADQGGANWETGLGTYSTIGPTLTRTTVFASSNAGATVNFSSGTQDVFCSYVASKSVTTDLFETPPAFGNITPNTGRFTTLTITAGTASVAPINFTAGTNLTTAAAGAMEYDGTAFYSSMAASTRGVVPSEQIVILTGTNTLISQTAVQPIFDGGGGTTNGAVTLPVGTYQFECMYAMTGMSATAGTFGFGLGGTATKTFAYQSTASKGQNTLAGTQATFLTFQTAAGAVSSSTTSTSGMALIKGIIRVTVAGTVIPQVSLSIASAAVVQANSYFKVSPVGNATVATVGNWS